MQAGTETTSRSNDSLAAAGSAARIDVASAIDKRNQEFISNTKAQLKNLNQFSTEALEWIMMEHYQFSFRNTEFLAAAAKRTGDFDAGGVQKELERNCAEEDGHAPMYKIALKKVNLDVETREEFLSTTNFLNSIGDMMNLEPSAVLGIMYATETAAIFEHEVFRDITKEVIERRKFPENKTSNLVYYHDMHLSGVEQSHKDELGVFLQGLPLDQPVASREGNRPTIRTWQALAGAEQAIEAMVAWWADLLAELSARSANRAIA